LGDRDFEPAAMMSIRLMVASLMLLAFLAARGELGELRHAPFRCYLLGLANAAIPFTLIAWGERYVDSGTAAVANSGVPLFVALIAPRLARDERVTGVRLLGLVVGFGGVVWLIGLDPHVSWWFVAGVGAIVLATAWYAVGTLWGQRLVVRTSGPVLATAAYLGATVMLAPLGVAQAPNQWPGWSSIVAVLGLALFGTAISQLLFFGVLERYGGARTTLATYLSPAFALLYGAVFLSEPLQMGKLGGFVLILAGVLVASGRSRGLAHSRSRFVRTWNVCRSVDAITSKTRCTNASGTSSWNRSLIEFTKIIRGLRHRRGWLRRS
jgi:drug/metabolite transporter (DMT)-like permease